MSPQINMKTADEFEKSVDRRVEKLRKEMPGQEDIHLRRIAWTQEFNSEQRRTFFKQLLLIVLLAWGLYWIL